MNLRVLLSSVALQATLIDAYSPYPPIKFRQWYPGSLSMVDAASQCAPELEAYWTQTQLYKNTSICGLAQNCLLSVMQEYTKANFAASTVLLGLMPTTLGFIGPNLQDTNILMMQRPLLTSLVLMGAPAINPIPLLSTTVEQMITKPSSVMVVLGRQFAPGVSRFQPQSKRSTSSRTMILFSILQYLLALSALTNTMQNTVELDFRTSVVWKCQAVGFLEIWVLLSMPIHWVATASLWCRIRVGKTPENREADVHGAENPAVDRSTILNRLSKIMMRWATLEPIPILFQHRPEWTRHVGSSNVASDLLSWLGSLLVLFHYGFGTLVFSSLLFIGVKDAASVLARYAASTILCRLLLWFELDSVNLQMQRDNHTGAVSDIEYEQCYSER